MFWQYKVLFTHRPRALKLTQHLDERSIPCKLRVYPLCINLMGEVN